jgi:maltose alpha-D-glucosyltransferase/alpha-amylase
VVIPVHDAAGDRLWYKDAVIYELHVRAFADSNGDGIGDFRGLLGKLDYLHDLGVTALWLLPFYPSPLRDDGYDIADYLKVHPTYGTLADFKLLLREAHRRGLRVITELVINHTSDQHPWFQRARRAPRGSRERDYYVWSDTPAAYADARIIFKDFETSNWTWDPLASAYYWHRFYSHQPDLNYDNPDVGRAIRRVLDFWLHLGVDGFRLDAIPYLFEREGTNCENLPETHGFLKELRKHVDGRFAGRMLLAEANQWPEDAAAYFGGGDECHMAFHFPLMPRLFMAIHMEDRFPIVDILEQTPPIPEDCQWATFLRNHDELTLEMVTDEDRDYMYRVYARDPQARINLGIRRRLAPLLENHRGKIELMKGLLFALPGTPVLYYGDDIGMGDNIYLGDRNGVRTPMQWSAALNAGFSVANPQRLYLPVVVDPQYHYQSINVEMQQNDPHSLLWWMKHLIALRKRHRALSRGTLEFLHPHNPKVLAFLRRYQDETVLVVANLSHTSQYVELDVRAFQGLVPVEIFGGTRFPPVREQPYFLSLGPYAFYWFALQARHSGAEAGRAPPTLPATPDWQALLRRSNRFMLERLLPDYLARCAWFGAKGRQIDNTEMVDVLELPGDSRARLTLVRVEFAEGDQEIYVVPLDAVEGAAAEALQVRSPQAVLARIALRGPKTLNSPPDTEVLCDPLEEELPFPGLLERNLSRRCRERGEAGELVTVLANGFVPPEPATTPAPFRKEEQANVTLVHDARWTVKVFRRIESGSHPEVEVTRYLQERQFAHVAPVRSVMEYRPADGEPMTLAVLYDPMPTEGDAWQATLTALHGFYTRALTVTAPVLAPPVLLEALGQPLPAGVADMAGAYLETIRLLGQRTAEMHLALGAATDDPSFAPEPFTVYYQRSLYQTLRNQVRHTFVLLRDYQRTQASVPPLYDVVLNGEAALLRREPSILAPKIEARRLRIHGNFDLTKVLYTGKDFVITGFGGDPERHLSYRRRKGSPLRDVGSLLHSLHVAALSARTLGNIRPEDAARLDPWVHVWRVWIGATFLNSYLKTAAPGGFLPERREALARLLNYSMVRQAVHDVREALVRRPETLEVALLALTPLIGWA